MGSAFGLLNKTASELWYVLRSSDGGGLVLKLPPEGNNIIRMRDGEIVTSFIFPSQQEAEASIGKGEKHKFKTVEAMP